MKKAAFFYGWIVVICCTMLAFSVNAMGNNSLSFYIASISDAFKVNRATTNFSLFTMGLFTRTILGFFFGKLAARFGVKRLMIIGLVFVLTGFMAYSYASSIVMIGLGSALYGIAHAIGTLSSYNVIINNWFVKNKGIMLAILNTAVGVGGMVINPLVSRWIERYGWNQSFLYTAMLIAAIAIPALIFVRESPRKENQKEQTPREIPNLSPIKNENANKLQGVTMTLKRAMFENRFWLLVAVQLLIGLSIWPCFSNAIPALKAMGVDPKIVSNVLSILIAFGIVVGHVTSGMLFDRFGLWPLMYVAVSVVSAGYIIMGFINAFSPMLIMIITIIFIGYGNAIQLGTLSHMINSIFVNESKDFSGLFGFLFAVQNIGIMIGSPISGMVYDKTNNYQLYYWFSVILLVIMLILLRIALRLTRDKFRVSIKQEHA